MSTHSDATHAGKEVCDTSCSMSSSTGDNLTHAAMWQQVGRALTDKKLFFHYQPVVTAADTPHGFSIIGAEALMRMVCCDGETISPDGFFGCHDDPAMARDMGCFVMDSVFSQAESWFLDGMRLHIALNISACHFLDTRFLADVEEALARYPSLPSVCVGIEITESAPLRDIGLAASHMSRCEEIGVAVVLDDFGTGSACLTHLKLLPVRAIKIDRSFIRQLDTDLRARAIVAGVVETARLLGLHVTAEGIETLENFNSVKNVYTGIRMQGYWIAKPMPADQFLEWVRQYS